VLLRLAMPKTYDLHLAFVSAPRRVERLSCSGVAEAMHHARRLVDADESVIDVVIHEGNAPIATVSRRARPG